MQSRNPIPRSTSEARDLARALPIAHEVIQKQRHLLQDKDSEITELKRRLADFEGLRIESDDVSTDIEDDEVDDYAIQLGAGKLEQEIARWAADVVRTFTDGPSMEKIYEALKTDCFTSAAEFEWPPCTPIAVQNFLKHSVCQTISEATINTLMPTSSYEHNVGITDIHDTLFARNIVVANGFRRNVMHELDPTSELLESVLKENLPSILDALHSLNGASHLILALQLIIKSGIIFSKVLHSSSFTSVEDFDPGLYKSYVPDVGGFLYPRQTELLKRCLKHDKNQPCVVGACVFPGLVQASPLNDNEKLPQYRPSDKTKHYVVRRAHVICLCALGASKSNEAPPKYLE